MSIGGIGTSGATNPLLTSLLSQIGSSSSSTSQATNPDDNDFTLDTGSTASNALTGSTTAQLSSSMMGVLLGGQQEGVNGSDPSDPNARTLQQSGQVHHGGGRHHHHHGTPTSSSSTDPLDQIMDAEAGSDTGTDALADLMTSGSDSTNPADFMAAIQKYQSQNAGTTQTTV